jgi:hypothetical protein
MVMGTRADTAPGGPGAESEESGESDDSPPGVGLAGGTEESYLAAALEGLGDGYTVLRAVRAGEAVTDWLVVDANRLVRDRWKDVVGDVTGVPLSVLNAAYDNRA